MTRGTVSRAQRGVVRGEIPRRVLCVTGRAACVTHGGWEPYLAKLGITSQRASEWMRLAGHVEAKSPTSSNAGDLTNAPTLAEATGDREPEQGA